MSSERGGAVLARLFVNFTSLVVAQVFYKITAAVTTLALARGLGDEAFGRLTYAVSLVALLEMSADIGLTQVLVREVASQRAEPTRLAGQVLALKLGLALAFLLSLTIVSQIIGLAPATTEVVLILGLGQTLMSFTLLWRAIFEFSERMHYEGLSIVLEGALKLALALAALSQGTGVRGVAYALLVAQVALLLLTIGLSRRGFAWPRGRPRPSGWWPMVREGLPFAGIALLGPISFRLNTLFVGSALGDAAAGWFGAALKLVEPLLIVPVMLAVALFPLAARLHATAPQSVSQLTVASQRLVLIGALPVAMVLASAADTLVAVFYGAPYRPAGALLATMAWVLVPSAAKHALHRVTYSVHLGVPLVAIYALGAGLNAALVAAWLPSAGALGAAQALVVGESATLLLNYWLLRRYLAGLPRVLLGLCGTGALAAICIWGLGPLWAPMRFILGLAVYVAGLLLFRLLTAEDARASRGLRDALVSLARLAAERANGALRRKA